MLILFWDIDGTLLSTGRAGIFAWEDATQEVLGAVVDFGTLMTSGLTDVEIGALILREHGAPTTKERIAEIVDRYARHLPRSLPRRDGRVMPNIRAILQAIRRRDNTHSMLLTGNVKAGARAKLVHYGLDTFFDFERGAFADGASNRAQIAEKAIDLVRVMGLRDDRSRMFVIGDTPHDIRGADAIGVRTLAVATGVHDRAELSQHDPWIVLDELPGPEAFLELFNPADDARAAG